MKYSTVRLISGSILLLEWSQYGLFHRKVLNKLNFTAFSFIHERLLLAYGNRMVDKYSQAIILLQKCMKDANASSMIRAFVAFLVKSISRLKVHHFWQLFSNNFLWSNFNHLYGNKSVQSLKGWWFPGTMMNGNRLRLEKK